MLDARIFLLNCLELLFCFGNKAAGDLCIGEKSCFFGLECLEFTAFRDKFGGDLFRIGDVLKMALARPLFFAFKARDAFGETVAVAGKLTCRFCESFAGSGVLQ